MKWAAFVALTLAAQNVDASAASYRVSGSATLESPFTGDSSGINTFPVPASSIKAGDKLTYSFTYNTGSFGAPYVYDSTDYIYNGYLTDFRFSVGSYKSSSNGDVFSGIQVWNDRKVDGGSPTDAFSIYGIRLIDGSLAPVALLATPVYEDLYFDFFDFSGMARKSASINEVENSSSYAYRGGFLAYSNPNANQQVIFDLDNIVMNFSAPLPEPTTWAMMIVGFGMVGCLSRRRSKSSTAAA